MNVVEATPSRLLSLPTPLCRSFVFEKPDRLVPPSAWESHIPFAFWLIDVHRPRTVVELGVHAGNSYCAFLQVIKKLELASQCYGVDTWRGDKHAGFYPEDVFVEFSRYHNERYEQFSTLVRRTFDEAVDYFEDGTIDLLHIDGLHTYDAVKHDFERWRPKLSNSAVVLFHDTNVRENEFGVWKLWEELTRRYLHFRFDHGHGLGVLGVGDVFPRDLKWLFDLSTSTAESKTAVFIRSFFSGLGSTLSERLRLNAAEVRFSTSDNLSERLRSQSGENARLKSKLSERTAENNSLRAQLSAVSAEIPEVRSQLSQQISEGERVSNELRRRARRRSAGVHKVRRKLATLLRKFGLPFLKYRQSDETLVRQSGLFDSGWYLAKNPDVAAAGVDPLTHYLQFGFAERRSPHPVFDSHWYLLRYPDVAAAGVNPLVHYLRSGAAEGRDPHSLFDSHWYLAQNPNAEAADKNPLSHYLEHGGIEGLDPHPLFDSDWYLAENPAVAAAGENPLLHYLRRGAERGRDPHPLFDSDWYLAQNPAVAAAGANPLLHYVRHGAAEGRDPHPLFDTNWYLARYRDVLGENPLAHYVSLGAAEGRDPSPGFSTSWYADQAKLPASINPLVHFLGRGLSLEMSPNPSLPIARFEAVTQRLKRESGYQLEACHLAPVNLFPLPKKLDQLLHLWYDESAIASLKAYYHFIVFYRDFRIDNNTLDASSEVLQLLKDITELARQKGDRGSFDATIVIPAHNQLAFTLCCLKAVLALPTRYTYEIIVADDASTDDTPRAIGGIGGIVRLVRSDINQGFLHTCNVAAAQARGKVIVLLNNDTVPLPRWLDEIIDTLRADPKIGLVGPKLINMDGTLQEAGGIIFEDSSGWNFGRGSDAAGSAYSYVKETDFISGAAIAIPVSVWQELGGFDEVYSPAYYEDVDLAFRIRGMGFRTVYQPFSRVIHFEGISHGRNLLKGVKSYQTRNASLFHQRWRETLAVQNFPSRSALDPRARDRSQGRPRVLIVDHYVPEPDRDSGSRAMLDYLKLFVSAGFHVTFWSQNLQFDPHYTPPLQRLGIEVVYHVGTDLPLFEDWLKLNGVLLDYVILSRPTVAAAFIELISVQCDAKILYFGVDIHFQRYARELQVTGSALAKQEMIQLERIERDVWAKSDVIYYYSEEERNFVQSDCPGRTVRAIPIFTFDAQRLGETRDRILRDRSLTDRQVIFVAGFRHSPNVNAVLWFVAEAWPRIIEAVPDARLCIVGSSPPTEVTALAGRTIMVTGPVSDEVLNLLYRSSSVSVVPLRYGAGVKGKVLEAVSFGVPVVTTASGVQGIPGAAAFVDVCEGSDELAAAVIEILRNPASRVGKLLLGINYLESEISEAKAREILALDIPELSNSAN